MRTVYWQPPLNRQADALDEFALTPQHAISNAFNPGYQMPPIKGVCRGICSSLGVRHLSSEQTITRSHYVQSPIHQTPYRAGKTAGDAWHTGGYSAAAE